MSKNIDQIYTANPITTNASTDLMYFGQSPYGSNDDAAMLYSDFAAQFSGGGVTPAQVQQSAFNYGVDTGTADNYIVDFTPPIASLTDGLLILFTPANANTSGAANLTINGIGPNNIVNYDTNNESLTAGQLANTSIAFLVWSAQEGTFILLNPALQPYADVTNVQQSTFNHGTDTGASANNYVVNLFPVIGSLTDGLLVSFTPVHDNTNSTANITINGVGPTPIVNYDTANAALISGQLVTTQVAFLIYSLALNSFILLNPAVIAGGGGGVTSTQVQQSAFNYGVDTGPSNNNYIVDLNPPIGALTDGLLIAFTPAHQSTNASANITVNGFGPSPIQNSDGNIASISNGQLTPTQIAYMIYSSAQSAFLLLNPAILPYASNVGVQFGLYNYGADTGAADDYQVTLNPATFGLHDGEVVSFTPANNNLTTTPTLNVNSLGGITMTTSSAAIALAPGQISTTQLCYCVYSQTANKFLVLTTA